MSAVAEPDLPNFLVTAGPADTPAAARHRARARIRAGAAR
jgi:hypothetical protein